MTSITDSPLCAMAVFMMACNCFLSPLKERATKVAPHLRARAQQSKGGRSLTVPVLSVAVVSAGAQNSHEIALVIKPASIAFRHEERMTEFLRDRDNNHGAEDGDDDYDENDVVHVFFPFRFQN